MRTLHYRMDQRMTEYLPESEHRRLKSNLTRAIKSGDSTKVIQTCRDAQDIFEHFTYPDDWSRWRRAWDDAVFALQRETANRW
jgi:hypothetical protein